MFENSGKTIKAVAIALCCFGVFVSIFYGLTTIFTEEDLTGLLTLFIGSLVSWVGTLPLYGLGEMIENSTRIVELLEEERNAKNINAIPMSNISKPSESENSNNDYDNSVKNDIVQKMIEGRIRTLEKERAAGNLTEEEFNAKKKELLDA